MHLELFPCKSTHAFHARSADTKSSRPHNIQSAGKGASIHIILHETEKQRHTDRHWHKFSVATCRISTTKSARVADVTDVSACAAVCCVICSWCMFLRSHFYRRISGTCDSVEQVLLLWIRIMDRRGVGRGTCAVSQVCESSIVDTENIANYCWPKHKLSTYY